MPIPCTAFGDFLSRRAEHLDDEIIMGMHPYDTWIGHVATGKFAAQDGVEHTFDRFEQVFPDLTGPWENVESAPCVGTPCDPDAKKIGFGYTRDSYRLQRKAFETDLFCWDLILSADRAKRQFSSIVENLRRASTIVSSDRARHEAARIARYKWVTSNNTNTAATWYWDSTGTILNVSAIPTSKMQPAHLQRRVMPQTHLGALGAKLDKNSPPMLEFVNDPESMWEMVEGNPALADHWRFQLFPSASKEFYRYGWGGTIGNYGVRSDSMPLRFLNLNTQNADGTWQLRLVYPYTNVAATSGIKEDLNDDFLDAQIQMNFIWHRQAMTFLVRDTTSIHPEMPFASRDFSGKWQFVMDNLTCGTAVDANGVVIPIAVDNSRRNKGKFIADFSLATQALHPEFAEAFLTLREPACIVDKPPCASDPGYPAQSYDSNNAPCEDDETTITFTPVLNAETGTYEVLANTIQCNGIEIVHSAITGHATLADLVVELNDKLDSLGTWAVDGTDITLVGTACTSAAIPWTVNPA